MERYRRASNSAPAPVTLQKTQWSAAPWESREDSEPSESACTHLLPDVVQISVNVPTPFCLTAAKAAGDTTCSSKAASSNRVMDRKMTVEIFIDSDYKAKIIFCHANGRPGDPPFDAPPSYLTESQQEAIPTPSNVEAETPGVAAYYFLKESMSFA